MNGDVCVVSGRTSAHHTEILEGESFRTGFTNGVLDKWSGKFIIAGALQAL